MNQDIVFLDQLELTRVSREALEGVGTVRTVQVTAQEGLLAAVRDADAILYQSFPLRITRRVLERCRRLKVIGRIGIGMDHVDLGAAAGRGVTVVNAAGTQAAAVADHAMALILCLARNVVASHNSLLAGDRRPPRDFMGCELDGKNLGIIGFGAIGRHLARRALAFGMSVHTFDAHLPAGTIEESGALPRSLHGLLADSDFISIHVPLTGETRHLIGADELAVMRSTAYVVNTARGAIIDEQALVRALREGVIAGAGLDVFEEEPLPAESPLLGLDQVVLTPHIGGWAAEAQTRAQESVVKDVARVLRGETPASPVTSGERPTAGTTPPVAVAGSVPRERPAGTPGILPYVEWNESGLAHPSDTHPFGTVPALRRIIETEGPITADRAYRLYVRGSGSTRVTKLARGKLDVALNRLLDQNQVQIDELDSDPGNQVQRVLRSPGTSPVSVREIGNRDLYEIPLTEIASLMGLRLERYRGASHDQLMRYVLNTYGWKRLTDKARSYLTAAIRLMYEE